MGAHLGAPSYSYPQDERESTGDGVGVLQKGEEDVAENAASSPDLTEPNKPTKKKSKSPRGRWSFIHLRERMTVCVKPLTARVVLI